MKNAEVAHRWANKQRATGSNCHTDGVSLWSYSTVIAKHVRGENEPYDAYTMISPLSYSKTTSKQQAYARSAAHGNVIYAVPDDKWATRDYYTNTVGGIRSRMARSRKLKPYHEQLDRLHEQITNVVRCTGYSMDVPLELSLVPDEERVYPEPKPKVVNGKVLTPEQILFRRCKNFRNFKVGHVYGLDYNILRVNERGLVETSNRISLSPQVALVAYQELKAQLATSLPKRVTVRGFEVSVVNDTFVQAGCHKILWTEIEDCYATLCHVLAEEQGVNVPN
jgi:hypothetical protein